MGAEFAARVTGGVSGTGAVVVGSTLPAAQVRPPTGLAVTEPTVAEVIVTGNGLGLVTVAATDPTVPEP